MCVYIYIYVYICTFIQKGLHLLRAPLDHEPPLAPFERRDRLSVLSTTSARACLSVRAHMLNYVYMRTCVYVYAISLSLYIYIYICMYVCIYIYIYTHVCI